MDQVIYFNITYRCNSKCTFCFSNSTNYINEEMDVKKIKEVFKKVSIDKDDLIVINGGEPFMHSQIRDILQFLRENINCKKKIYTNASKLWEFDAKDLQGFSYVIPIHGNRMTHEKITCISGMFECTMNSINKLQEEKIEYELKFILNDTMVNSDFDIKYFLESYNLQPNRIVLARLNETTKSKRNEVIIPTNFRISKYINKQITGLSELYEIVLLDIPPCFLDARYHNIVLVERIPNFFFSDVNIDLEMRTYSKKIKVGSNCASCSYSDLCAMMSNTYLTMVLKNSRVYMEKE